MLNNAGGPVENSVEFKVCFKEHQNIIHNCLQQHAKALLLHVKDTLVFINKITETEHIRKDKFPVTLDVKSLYNNTSNHKEIKAAKELLNSLKQKRCKRRLS